MASQFQITTGDKLMVVPNLTRSIGAAIFRLITYPLSGGAKANTVFKDVFFAALRTNLSICNSATEQYMNPSTESGYLELAKKQGFQPDTDILSSGLKVHWIGGKTAEKILLFFHGGGYALSCSPGHFAWLYDLQIELSKTQSISVVLVGYTLSPYGSYPTQLKQAAESLEWLLTDQKKKPSNIFISGDSAGGNMALSLMSHLVHPHPEVSNKISLSEPIAGAILISPWIKFTSSDDSFQRNATSDMVVPAAVERWSSLFRGSSPPDNYNEPILADADWFKGFDSKVGEILVWGGGSEVLIDSIEAITKKLKDAHPKTELVVQPNAAHEDFIFDKLLGYSGKGEGTKLIESWISARL